MESTQEATCPSCGRPLPSGGGVCRYCGVQAAGFHVRPVLLGLVLIMAAAFGAATVFANRFYQSKQQRLGEMWFGRGQAALAAGRPEPAIQDFRNALYYSHDDPSYRLQLAKALAAANRIPEAQSYLVTLWQDEPSNSTVNLQLARLAAKQDESQTALRYYHGAIYGLWPNGEAAIRRQQTRMELIRYLLDLNDTNQADAELIALTPELPRDAAAHTNVGRLFRKTGDQSRALEEFELALRLNPRDSSAAFAAGEAAFRLGQYHPAEYYLDRAVRLQRPFPQAKELLATTRLIFSLNPNQPGLSLRQRAQRVAQAFQHARQRLQNCTAGTGMDLQSVPAPETPPASNSAAPSAPAPKQVAPGLMAKILGKVERRPAAATPQPASAANAAVMQQLHQQVTNLQKNVRPDRLERDPQLANSVLALVDQIETVSAQQCGAPEGADLALLLLAHQGEEP